MAVIDLAILRKTARFPHAAYVPHNMLLSLDGYEGVSNRKLDPQRVAEIVVDFDQRDLGVFSAFVDPTTCRIYEIDGHHRSAAINTRITQGLLSPTLPVMTILHTQADVDASGKSRRDYLLSHINRLNNHGIETFHNMMQRTWPTTPWGEAHRRLLGGEPLWGNAGFTATVLLKARTRVDRMRALIAPNRPAITVLWKPGASPNSEDALKTMLTAAPADIERTLQTVRAWETRVAQALPSADPRKVARSLDATAFALMVGDAMDSDRMDDAFDRVRAHFPAPDGTKAAGPHLWARLLQAANYKLQNKTVAIMGVYVMEPK